MTRDTPTLLTKITKEKEAYFEGKSVSCKYKS